MNPIRPGWVTGLWILNPRDPTRTQHILRKIMPTVPPFLFPIVVNLDLLPPSTYMPFLCLLVSTFAVRQAQIRRPPTTTAINRLTALQHILHCRMPPSLAFISLTECVVPRCGHPHRRPPPRSCSQSAIRLDEDRSSMHLDKDNSSMALGRRQIHGSLVLLDD